jgi:hypothetical protein
VHRKLAVAGAVTVEPYRGAERYIVMTGNALPGAPLTLADLDAVMDQVVEELDAALKRAGGTRPADDAAGAAHQGTHELLPRVASFLFIEGNGPYTSRSELLFSFLIAALQANVADDAIAAACHDQAYARGGIYQHVAGNAQGYIERQIQRARAKVKETRASEMMTDLGNARGWYGAGGSTCATSTRGAPG